MEKGDCTREDIIEFFKSHEALRNHNNDEYYYDYSHVIIRVVSQIIKSAPYAINILEYVFSIKPNNNMDRAYLCDEVIVQLVQFPEGYKKIHYILQETINSGMISEDINDLSDRNAEFAKVLKEYFEFIPVSSTAPLIEDNIDDVHPVISNILKKTHTDLIGDDREKLKIYLLKDLSHLISDEYIKIILTKCSEFVGAMNIYNGRGGGSYHNNKIDISGAKEYVSGKEKYTLPSVIVHESVHLYMDNLFHNQSNPFKKDAPQSLEVWKEVTEKIYTALVDTAGIYDRSIALESDKFGSIECNSYSIRTYKENLRIVEVPAFFIQDIAIRILAAKADEKMEDSVLQQFHEIDELMQGILGAVSSDFDDCIF